MLSAVWIVHIPAITERTGVSHAALGMLLLFMAACAIAGMQTAGPLADRLGSRTLTTVAAAALSLSLIGLGFATGPLTLALALAVYGIAVGGLDVSMNAQAVHIERAYPRPIMSAFHAFFSCGGLVGAIAGSAAQKADWSIHLTFTAAAVAGAAVVAACAPLLLPHTAGTTSGTTPSEAPATAVTGPHDTVMSETLGTPTSGAPETTSEARSTATSGRHDTTAYEAVAATTSGNPEPVAATSEPGAESTARDEATSADGALPVGVAPGGAAPSGDLGVRAAVAPRRRRRIPREVLLLGVIAFAMLMAEGVAADWSALQLRDRLGVDDGTAGLAFAGFSLTMTLGRFAADRVSARIGRVAVVRWGTLIAAAGFTLIVVSGWAPVTLAGWALCGVGLSGGIPQVFTAAGNLGSGSSATDMSRVFGLGYLGLLAGPAIIGWLTEAVPLTAAMALPLIAMLLCAWGARAVAPVTREAAA